MSRWGAIHVDCDAKDCHASLRFGPSDIESELADLLSDADWTRTDAGDCCPECSAGNREPPEPDGEVFRGREAEGFTRERQADIQRELKR